MDLRVVVPEWVYDDGYRDIAVRVVAQSFVSSGSGSGSGGSSSDGGGGGGSGGDNINTNTTPTAPTTIYYACYARVVTANTTVHIPGKVNAMIFYNSTTNNIKYYFLNRCYCYYYTTL